MTVPIPAALSASQVEVVRAHHRGTRTAGFVVCLVGVLVMIAGRYAPAAPVWVTSVGVGTIAFGWGLFGYALYKRVTLARSIASEGGG
ncbi:MAG TPA: hypothetical protein VIE70_07650 [Dongiaceae bacterium]